MIFVYLYLYSFICECNLISFSVLQNVENFIDRGSCENTQPNSYKAAVLPPHLFISSCYIAYVCKENMAVIEDVKL